MGECIGRIHVTGGLRCLKAGPAAVSDMVSAQLTESDFQTHPRACLKIKICTKHMFY